MKQKYLIQELGKLNKMVQMDEKLEDKLIKRFPKIFPNGLRVNPQQSLMCFGIACGDGWFDLLWKLCEDLEKLGDGIVVVQIKEKFSQLRFYTNSIPTEYADKAYDLIHEAEKKSGTICEKCGKPGKIRDDLGWILTLCDKHYQEKLDEIKGMKAKWEKRNKKKTSLTIPHTIRKVSMKQ